MLKLQILFGRKVPKKREIALERILKLADSQTGLKLLERVVGTEKPILSAVLLWEEVCE